jgi:hypothetical protein
MTDWEATDYGRDFVAEMLRTGVILTELVADLLEALPEDTSAESSAEVVLEMLLGTLRPVTEAAGETSLRSALALLTAVQDRTLADLERVAERAHRRAQRGHEGRRRRR